MCKSSLRKIGTCVLETYLGVMWHLFSLYITSFTEDDVHYIHIPLRRLSIWSSYEFYQEEDVAMNDRIFIAPKLGSTVIYGSVPHTHTHPPTLQRALWNAAAGNWHRFFSKPLKCCIKTLSHFLLWAFTGGGERLQSDMSIFIMNENIINAIFLAHKNKWISIHTWNF